MENNFELIKTLAHYSNDVNAKINEIASSSNDTLGKHQFLAANFADFSQQILAKLSEDEAQELTNYVSSVLNLFQESNATFEMEIDFIKWNTEKAKVYIKNYEIAAGL